MKKSNVRNPDLYMYYKDVYNNDNDNYITFLSRILQTRTAPEDSVILQDGYYVGKTIPSDDINTLEKNSAQFLKKL